MAATVAAALWALPAGATDGAAPATDRTPAAAPDGRKPRPDDRVCTVEKAVGSNMAKRVCRSRAQVEAERASAREAIERSQTR